MRERKKRRTILLKREIGRGANLPSYDFKILRTLF